MINNHIQLIVLLPVSAGPSPVFPGAEGDVFHMRIYYPHPLLRTSE